MILINILKELDKIDQKIIVYKPKYTYSNETNIINLYFTLMNYHQDIIF